jgi:hypothetical protein
MNPSGEQSMKTKSLLLKVRNVVELGRGGGGGGGANVSAPWGIRIQGQGFNVQAGIHYENYCFKR